MVTVPAALNSTALTLSSVAGLNAGQFVAINNYVGLVTSISGNTINLSPPLPFEVPINTLVTSTATPAGFFVTVAASLGTTELTLFSAAGLEVNQFVAINDYTGLITGINNETISLSPPLPFNVPEGTIVTPTPTPAGFFVTVAASLGTTELTLFSAAGLEVNQFVAINDYTGLITGINGDTISLSPPLDFDVEAGTIVTPTVLPDGFFVTVPAGQGAIELTLFSTVGLNVNQFVSINGILSLITAINGNTISLSPPVTADIPAGTIVTPTATPQGAFVIVPATINATTLAVNATTALSVNQFVTINTYTGVITQIVNNVITLSPPVPFAVPVGTVVSPAATPNDTLATPAASGSTTLTIGNASATGITNRSFVSVGGQTVRVSNVAGNVLTITPALTSSVPVGTRATIAPIPTVNAQANAIASASITLVPASSAAFFLVGDGVEIAGTTPEFGGGPRVVTGVNVATGQLTFGAPTITLPMGGTVKLLP
ncbi:MAG: hypothetical protein EA367_08660 [Leptolyngbya sp. DLM2.Bin15]|nr:MAG: hypothetical protein EA367_08660 [Leptolyngbya sp. DLM2.Bin15]